MKTVTCVLAILAAASTGALAKDLKQDKKANAPTVAATQMSDAEMDKVTAGAGIGHGYGQDNLTGEGKLTRDSNPGLGPTIKQ